MDDAPAIVVVAKADGRFVLQVGGVEGGADFVKGNPFPGEVDVGNVVLFADAGDGDELPAGDGDAKGRAGGFIGGNEGTDGFDP